MLTWTLFKHYLLSNRAGAVVRTVSWLCMMGVGIGVMSLVVVLSVMNGFNGSIKRRLLAVEPHLVVTVPNARTTDQVETSDAFKYLRALPHVQSEAFESQDVLIRTIDGTYGGGVARGVTGSVLSSIMTESQRADRSRDADEDFARPLPAKESENLAAGEVMMGVGLARALGVFEGDEVVVIAPEGLLLPPGELPQFERLKVKSLISTNVPEVDEKIVYYGRGRSLTHLRESSSREVGIEVRLPDPENFSAVKTALEKRGAVVSTWIDRNSSLFYALRLEKICMGTFLGLSALIASFSIITVMVLLLMQKRQDIGVLMAMGLSATSARNLFLRLGFILSGFGFGGGLSVGLLICYIIQRYPLPLLPNIYYDTTIPAKAEPVLIIGITIFSFVIAFAGSWYPARRYTSMTPADALRKGSR